MMYYAIRWGIGLRFYGYTRAVVFGKMLFADGIPFEG